MTGFAVAVAVLTSCAGSGNIDRSAPPSHSASQLPTPTVSLPTRHQVGSAHGDSQSNADEAESRTHIEPTNRGGDSLSRTDVDAISDGESLAVTDPRADHRDPDPDSHCCTEPVDCHPVGDHQPIADG